MRILKRIIYGRFYSLPGDWFFQDHMIESFRKREREEAEAEANKAEYQARKRYEEKRAYLTEQARKIAQESEQAEYERQQAEWQERTKYGILPSDHDRKRNDKNECKGCKWFMMTPNYGFVCTIPFGTVCQIVADQYGRYVEHGTATPSYLKEAIRCLNMPPDMENERRKLNADR